MCRQTAVNCAELIGVFPRIQQVLALLQKHTCPKWKPGHWLRFQLWPNSALLLLKKISSSYWLHFWRVNKILVRFQLGPNPALLLIQENFIFLLVTFLNCWSNITKRILLGDIEIVIPTEPININQHITRAITSQNTYWSMLSQKLFMHPGLLHSVTTLCFISALPGGSKIQGLTGIPMGRQAKKYRPPTTNGSFPKAK